MQDIEAVAKVLTNFFHHDGFLDVVPSDVAAGILLVRLQQRALASLFGDERNESKTTSPCYGDSKGPRDSDVPVVAFDCERDDRDRKRHDLTSSRVNKGAGFTHDKHVLYQQLPARTRMTLRAARNNLDKLNPRHLGLCSDLYRGSQYAFAIYTHLLYLYANPVTGVCVSRMSHTQCMPGD